MKSVRFARRWRRRLNDSTVEEYPAGASAVVSNARADAAQRAGVLDGQPVDAPPQTTDEPGLSDDG